MKRHYLILVSFVVLIMFGSSYTTVSVTYADNGTDGKIEISPEVFNKGTNHENNKNIIVSWTGNRTLAEIKQGPAILRKDIDYTIGTNSATIKRNYLWEQLTGGHKSYPIDLTLEFTEGPPEHITIKIEDTEKSMKLNGNIIVNHSLGIPYHDQGILCGEKVIQATNADNSDDTNGTPNPPSDCMIAKVGEVNINEVGQYLIKFINSATSEEVARRVNVLPHPVTAVSTQAGEISVYNAMPNSTLVVYDELDQRIAAGKANKDGEYNFTKIQIGNYYVVQIPDKSFVESQKSNKVDVKGPGAPFLIGSTGGEGKLFVTNATPNAQIKLFNSSNTLIKTIRANKDGEAEFTNIPVGTGYYVVVSYNGIDGHESNKAAVGNVDAVKISADDLTQTIDVRNAVPNATLKLFDRFDRVVATGKADKEGNYVFTKVRPGNGYYVIQTYNRNDSPKSNTVSITAVPLRDVLISVNSATSEINVEGAEEGATVTLFDSKGKALMTGKADKSGNFVFKNVPAGNGYYVIQSKDGRESIPSNKVNVIGDSANLKDIYGSWAEQPIIGLVNTGALSGYPDGTFRPNNTITRAEFVSILIRALNIEGDSGKEFVDMRNHWARNAVTLAAGKGIIPSDKSHFGPNIAITREEMAYMIVKAKNYSSRSSNLKFKDEYQISSWAKNEVRLAVQNEIIFGYNDGTFRPKQTATRAEAAAMIYRAIYK